MLEIFVGDFVRTALTSRGVQNARIIPATQTVPTVFRDKEIANQRWDVDGNLKAIYELIDFTLPDV